VLPAAIRAGARIRIKDLASVEGVRSNQLIGYGLVVGLPGTGKNNAFTEQTFRTMLNNFGIKVPDNIKPKIKDVAPVPSTRICPPSPSRVRP
jgi:flagellar P-ring protein precursor FlgI